MLREEVGILVVDDVTKNLQVVGTMLRHVQARWMVIFGVLVSASGLLIMSKFNLYIDYQTAVWSRMVQSAGMAFLFVPGMRRGDDEPAPALAGEAG